MKPALLKLDLELLHPAAARQRTGMTVLVAGVLLVLAVAVHFVRTGQGLDVMDAGAQHAADAASAISVLSGSGSRAEQTDETAAVRDGIARLALPWGTLFAALEAVPADDVTLLSVEPEAEKSTVKIVAEAPDVYAMLEYVRGLSRQGKLGDVLLGQYEVRLDDANQPVRFTLTATWGPLP